MFDTVREMCTQSLPEGGNPMNELTDHLHEAFTALTRARLEVHDVAFTMREIADALIEVHHRAAIGHDLRELADRLHRSQR